LVGFGFDFDLLIACPREAVPWPLDFSPLNLDDIPNCGERFPDGIGILIDCMYVIDDRYRNFLMQK
jgi:hypothetical protein